MAFRKAQTLAQRLYHISNTRFASPSSQAILSQLLAQNPATTTFRREFHNAPESEEKGFFRRYFHKPALVDKKSESSSSAVIGEKVMKKLKLMNFSRDRLRLDGLIPPLVRQPEPPEEISVEDAKKLLRVSHLEMLKSTLRQVPKNCISYAEFIEICIQGSSPDQGLGFAKILDDSGSVIVLGNVVFLRPEQVTKAIEGVIPLTIPNASDPLRIELEKMEKLKAEIDREAEALVKRELWAGLGFLVVQTAGFMRLTFWELSWDVMEPICFYVTSIYFMAGYSFFLRTSKDPSFEGFFESRFDAKKKRLMKKKNFDVKRFNELRRACYPFSGEPSLRSGQSHSFDGSGRSLVGAVHN